MTVRLDDPYNTVDGTQKNAFARFKLSKMTVRKRRDRSHL